MHMRWNPNDDGIVSNPCALRALMMPISLSILLPSHFGRVIKIHRDILVS